MPANIAVICIIRNTAKVMPISSAENLAWSFTSSLKPMRRMPLYFMAPDLRCRRPVPPAAAEGDEQGHGVLMALCDGLQIGDGGLVVLHVGRQDVQVSDQPGAVVGLQQAQCFAGGALRVGLRLQCLGVMLQRLQGIGDLRERIEHRLPIIRLRLLIGFDGRLAAVPQSCRPGTAVSSPTGRCSRTCRWLPTDCPGWLPAAP